MTEFDEDDLQRLFTALEPVLHVSSLEDLERRALCVHNGDARAFNGLLRHGAPVTARVTARLCPSARQVVFLGGCFNVDDMSLDELTNSPHDDELGKSTMWFFRASFDNLFYEDYGAVDFMPNGGEWHDPHSHGRDRFVAHSARLRFVDCIRFAYDDYPSALNSCSTTSCAHCTRLESCRELCVK